MEEKKLMELLKENTNMTDRDISQHIADGVTVYNDPEEGYKEFLENWVGGLNPEEEAPEAWEELEKVGKYKIDFCL